MRLSIQTYAAVRLFGEEKSFKLIKEAGFEAIDYSFYDWTPENTMLGEDYKQRAENTKKLLEKYDLVCNQAHAPARTIFFYSDFSENNPSFLELVRSIEYASIIGASNIIVHGIKSPYGVDSEDCFSKNLSFFKTLQTYAEKFKIKISVENLIHSAFITPFLLSQIIESLPESTFNICLDIGHSNCVGIKPADFIKQLPTGRLQALHIHDNLGSEDLHLLPFMGNIDWNQTIKTLVKYNYNGDLTLEIEGFLNDLSFQNASEKYKKACDNALTLKNLFQAQKDV